MTDSLTTLDEDMERMQNFTTDQVLKYLDFKASILMHEFLKNKKQNPADAVKSSCILFQHCIPRIDSISNAEKYVLATACPLLRELFEEMLANIFRQLEDERVEVVQGLLQVVITLIGCTKSCVQFFIQFQNVAAPDLELFSKEIFPIITKTIEHCSRSSIIYKNRAEYTDVLNCMLQEAGDLVTKLIFLYKDVVNFDQEDNESNVNILSSLAEFIGDVSRFSQVLGVRVMTECWKFYSALTGKYSKNLISEIDVDRPVKYLAEEVVRLVNTCSEGILDVKLMERNLKMASFMLRLLISLLESGYSVAVKRSSSSIVCLLLTLQRHSHLAFKLFDLNPTPCINLVERQLVIGISSIIATLAVNRQFTKQMFVALHTGKCLDHKKEPISEILINVALLQELNNLDSSARQNWLEKGENVFSLLLLLLDKCPVALSLIGKDSSACLVEKCLSGCIGLALTLSTQEFSILEDILFSTICSTPSTPWPWILVNDLWVCLASLGPQLCLDHLNCLQSAVKSLPENSPQKMNIVWLMLRLEKILPRSEIYSEVPQFEVAKIKYTISTFMEKPSHPAYQEMLCLLVTISRKKPNDELLECALQLMPFLEDGDLGELLGDKVFDVLIHFVDIMTNVHLVQILSQICMLSSPFLKIKLLAFLSKLDKRKFDSDDNQRTVLQLVSEVFNYLLLHFNPIVQQGTLKSFASFALASPHEGIVSMAVKNSKVLQGQVSSFIQGTSCSSSVPAPKETRRLARSSWEKNGINVNSDEGGIANFFSLDNNDYFDLDEDQTQNRSQKLINSDSCSPCIDNVVVHPHAFSKGEGSPPPEFSSNSQVSEKKALERSLEENPDVRELCSMIDSLVRSNKNCTLVAADKKRIESAIKKLQSVVKDIL